MVGAISFSGLASGLDTAAIIDALLTVERLPIQLLEARRSDAQEKVNLVGTFRGLVQTLRDRSSDLATSSEFLSFAAETSLPGIVDVTVSSTATQGSHSITPLFLATADRWVFDSVADADVDLGTADGQTLSFDYDGTTHNFSFVQANSGLNKIAAEINSLAGDDVTATVVNTGTSGSPSYELVVSGRETGRDFRITNISTTITGLTINATEPDVNGVAQSVNNLTVSDNAVADIDGLVVERSTNDFSDVIEGVSINLISADATSPTAVSVTISPDRTAIKNGITEFVAAFNAVADFVSEQNSFDIEAGAGGELFGESILRSTISTIRGALFNQSAADAAADTAGFGTLRLVGIEADGSGKLSINDTVLDKKLNEDLDAFASLFVDSDGFDNAGALPGDPGFFIDTTADSGLADDLMRALDGLLTATLGPNNSSNKGVFDVRIDALNTNIGRINDEIDVRELRLDRFEENLVRRFTALEQLMGQLNAQQAFLSSTFR